MRMKNWIRLSAILLPVLLAACQTEDNTQEAMLRAREFALEQTRMLPETARNHIRYVTPKVQFLTIFPHKPMLLTEYAHIPRNVDRNARQDPKRAAVLAQFVWDPPGLGYSVIAIGHSRRDLDHWEPYKVILKNTAPYQKLYELARAAAVFYVTNNMLYLTNLERLRVNSAEAEVRETSFDLDYLYEEKLQGSRDEWKLFLDDLNDRLKQRQFSLVWRADDQNRRIVVTGMGSVADLEKWTPACGMVIPAAQLDKYTVAIRRKEPEADGSVKKETETPDKTAPAGETGPAEKKEPVRQPGKPAASEKLKP